MYKQSQTINPPEPHPFEHSASLAHFYPFLLVFCFSLTCLIFFFYGSLFIPLVFLTQSFWFFFSTHCSPTASFFHFDFWFDSQTNLQTRWGLWFFFLMNINNNNNKNENTHPTDESHIYPSYIFHWSFLFSFLVILFFLSFSSFLHKEYFLLPPIVLRFFVSLVFPRQTSVALCVCFVYSMVLFCIFSLFQSAFIVSVIMIIIVVIIFREFYCVLKLYRKVEEHVYEEPSPRPPMIRYNMSKRYLPSQTHSYSF